MDLDVNFPRTDEEGPILPQAEAFTPMAPQTLAGAVPQDESSSEAAVAPQRRKRREPKILPVDQTQELRNTDLTQWNNEYLTNMDNAKKVKLQQKVTSTAKQNAANWVLGVGIGGVGASVGVTSMKGPLAAMFSGDALLQALTGTPGPISGRKRSSEELEGDESESEARRVRMRRGDQELGRAQGLGLDDDDAMVLPGSEVSFASANPTSVLNVHRQSRWVDTHSQRSKTRPNIRGIEARRYETPAKGRML